MAKKTRKAEKKTRTSTVKMKKKRTNRRNSTTSTATRSPRSRSRRICALSRSTPRETRKKAVMKVAITDTVMSSRRRINKNISDHPTGPSALYITLEIY